MKKSYRALFLIGCLFLVGETAVQAQDDSGYIKQFGEPGVPKMTVYLWGDAANNGIWRVDEGTDLLTFLSVAAASGFADRRPDVQTNVVISIYRQGEGGGSGPLFQSEATGILSEPRSSLPALRDDDVVVVETQTRRRFTWRDISQITGTAASLLSLYFSIQRLRD